MLSLKLLCERQVVKLRKLERKRYSFNRIRTFTHLQPSKNNTPTHNTENGEEISRKWQLILAGSEEAHHHCPTKKTHNPSSLQNIILKTIVVDNKNFLRICKMLMPFRIRQELIEWQLLLDMTLRFRFYKRISLFAAHYNNNIYIVNRHFTTHTLLEIWEACSKQYVGLPENYLFYHKQFNNMGGQMCMNDVIEAEAAFYNILKVCRRYAH